MPGVGVSVHSQAPVGAVACVCVYAHMSLLKPARNGTHTFPLAFKCNGDLWCFRARATETVAFIAHVFK